MRPFQKSLLARIVVSFFLLSSFVVICMSVFSFSYFIRGTERRATEQMQGLSAIKVEMLDRWVDEQRMDVLSLSQLSEVIADSAVLGSAAPGDPRFDEANLHLHSFFAGQSANYPELEETAILSIKGGRVVFSTDRSQEGRYRVQDKAFIDGKKATTIENVYPSPNTLEPTMTISTPLIGASMGVVAVLAADLDLDTMEGIIGDRTGLGRTGDAYLVDQYGELVGKSRGGFPRGLHSTGIDRALAGENGSGLYRNYAGVPVIGVYRWVPERDLALILEIPQEEAFQPARAETLILVLIGLAIAAAAAAGVYLLARRIAAPILAVQHSAQRVSGGDLSTQAPVLTGDEIGELAKSFNDMTVKVKDLYDELKRNEEHFRALIESSTDIVVVFDDRLTVSFVSPSVTRRHREAATGGQTDPRAKDGGDRPSGRGNRPRLQQPAHRSSRLCRRTDG